MSLYDTEGAYMAVQTVNDSNKTITHRRMVSQGGANPALNPVSGAIAVSIATTVGSTAVTLAAPAGNWSLEVGDALSLGSTAAYVVQARNIAAGGKFTGVQISPATTLASSAGTAVGVVWTNDYPVLATVSSYPNQLIDGTLVTLRDLRVFMLPTDTAGRTIPTPLPVDRSIIDGVARSVGIVRPRYIGANPVIWEVQAKG